MRVFLINYIDKKLGNTDDITGTQNRQRSSETRILVSDDLFIDSGIYTHDALFFQPSVFARFHQDHFGNSDGFGFNLRHVRAAQAGFGFGLNLFGKGCDSVGIGFDKHQIA